MNCLLPTPTCPHPLQGTKMNPFKKCGWPSIRGCLIFVPKALPEPEASSPLLHTLHLHLFLTTHSPMRYSWMISLQVPPPQPHHQQLTTLAPPSFLPQLRSLVLRAVIFLFPLALVLSWSTLPPSPTPLLMLPVQIISRRRSRVQQQPLLLSCHLAASQTRQVISLLPSF